MRENIKRLAQVQLGYSFRSKLDPCESGRIAVIQMKDLGDNLVDTSGLVRVDAENIKASHHIQVGDLVFRARGSSTTSAILLDDPGPTVVAAPLIRIRVTSESILPAYLHWFINQPPAQASLASRAKGTSQRMISKQALEALEIHLPSLERQKEIIELVNLSMKEQDILKRLSNKRSQYIATKLMHLAKGD